MDEIITLGKYEIIEELGRGGFGTVYKARDTVLGRVVALKVLHSQLTVDPGFISRFEQEAKLAAQLDHPNIVPIHDLGQAEGRYFIAMGLMSGGSLKDRLKKEGALSEEETKTILLQILNGLKVIHDNKIIHRDLKPGNILFDQYGTARISDLGFAKALHSDASISMSMSGGMVGTPAYMAPEVWRGNQASEQSDIYSLGCIIYEMLTGEVLFQGETPAMAMTKHLVERPEVGDKISSKWKALIEKSLAADLIDRFPNVQSVWDDIAMDNSDYRENSLVQYSSVNENTAYVYSQLSGNTNNMPEDYPVNTIPSQFTKLPQQVSVGAPTKPKPRNLVLNSLKTSGKLLFFIGSVLFLVGLLNRASYINFYAYLAGVVSPFILLLGIVIKAFERPKDIFLVIAILLIGMTAARWFVFQLYLYEEFFAFIVLSISIFEAQKRKHIG